MVYKTVHIELTHNDRAAIAEGEAVSITTTLKDENGDTIVLELFPCCCDECSKEEVDAK